MINLIKMICICVASLAIIEIGWASPIEEIVNNQNTSLDNALSIEVRSSKSATYTNKSLPLQVTFSNYGDQPVKLLRVFKPTSVFFSVDSIISRSGKEIPVPKIQVEQDGQKKFQLPDPLRYLVLEPNESFTTQIDFTELLPANLKEDFYRISLTYFNQYGQDCFKGTKDLEVISVKIVDPPVENVPGSISEERAMEIARGAIAGKVKMRPNANVETRNTASQFIVAFGRRSVIGGSGAFISNSDFDVQVYINRLTGAVEAIRVGS